MTKIPNKERTNLTEQKHMETENKIKRSSKQTRKNIPLEKERPKKTIQNQSRRKT